MRAAPAFGRSVLCLTSCEPAAPGRSARGSWNGLGRNDDLPLNHRARRVSTEDTFDLPRRVCARSKTLAKADSAVFASEAVSTDRRPKAATRIPREAGAASPRHRRAQLNMSDIRVTVPPLEDLRRPSRSSTRRMKE